MYRSVPKSLPWRKKLRPTSSRTNGVAPPTDTTTEYDIEQIQPQQPEKQPSASCSSLLEADDVMPQEIVRCPKTSVTVDHDGVNEKRSEAVDVATSLVDHQDSQIVSEVLAKEEEIAVAQPVLNLDVCSNQNSAVDDEEREEILNQDVSVDLNRNTEVHDEEQKVPIVGQDVTLNVNEATNEDQSPKISQTPQAADHTAEDEAGSQIVVASPASSVTPAAGYTAPVQSPNDLRGIINRVDGVYHVNLNRIITIAKHPHSSLTTVRKLQWWLGHALPCKWLVRECTAPLDASRLLFAPDLGEKKVIVESVRHKHGLADDSVETFVLKGTLITSKDIPWSRKSLMVRFTTDAWGIFIDHETRYDRQDEQWGTRFHRYEFEIDVTQLFPEAEEGKDYDFEFVVRYWDGETEAWNNNHGSNYRLVLQAVYRDLAIQLIE
ncbi:hypothetical protein HK102_005940 [Quaeritorhiza haematococci]|nr:hypothetical protein HK102_005940 [Quaeritorhiza haematococci]